MKGGAPLFVSLSCSLLALGLVSGCASAPPYAVCGGQIPCAMGGCYAVSLTRSDGTQGTGSFCTNECRTDLDCPDGGACVALDHDSHTTYFCVDRCTSASDCYAGLVCARLTVAGSPALSACLP